MKAHYIIQLETGDGDVINLEFYGTKEEAFALAKQFEDAMQKTGNGLLKVAVFN